MDVAGMERSPSSNCCANLRKIKPRKNKDIRRHRMSFLFLALAFVSGIGLEGSRMAIAHPLWQGCGYLYFQA
jgi:hypothetical protein